MKISIAGKGGSGKTTTAGLLARIYARKGYPVIAIDGDSNPSLGMMLGIPHDEMPEVPILSPDLLTEVVDDEGKKERVLTDTVENIVENYGLLAADGVRLLSMKRIDHAGKG
ncbi:MAG TPA: AAA family ATPase [Anaerolineales bacterium]|nr:AAA family ATPase [Anaerolineales bacterium]